MIMEPIGVFRCQAKHRYDASRQPVNALPNAGHIILNPGCNYEQALQDLQGLSHIWLIFAFHKNAHWKPQVRPPRGTRKIGVFATRAPYRPNPIGLSCVKLLGVEGLRLDIGAHDLLDETPILDIKPYLPYADSFPEARCGWLDELDTEQWEVCLSAQARQQLAWLEHHSEIQIRAFLLQQLAENPFDSRRKRIRQYSEETWEIAYRTWRAIFTVAHATRTLTIEGFHSGYQIEAMATADDPHKDKALHRAFREEFSTT